MISFPPCFNCAHYDDAGACRAYPSGIPSQILDLGHEHDELRGDEANQVVFQIKPGRETQEEARQRKLRRARGE